jgi:flagellar hook-length control protein FliK
MNKPIQAIEPSKLFSPDAAGAAKKGGSEDGESSFSTIISRSKVDQSGTESGQSLHAPGKKLPGQESRIDEQQYAVDDSPASVEPTDTSGMPDVFEEPLLAAAVDLPEHLADQAALQQALAPDVPAVAEAGVVKAMDVGEQPVNTGELTPVRTAAQLSDQLAGAPGKLPVANEPVANEKLQPDIVHDVGDVKGVSASYLTAADSGHRSSDTEPAANAVREAVQSAIANQAASRDLKQFLQQNRNHQAASNILPASDSAEAHAVPFLQTLSDSALLMPSARIPVPVGQPGWGQAVGAQIAWFVSQNISAASIRLNPQHLGPLEMEVTMDGDRASVSFTSQQGLVREALESSIPRLREMLSENGLNLVNVNVSQHGNSRQDGQSTPGSRQGAGVANDEGGTNEPAASPGIRNATILTQGLVDFYA